MSQLVSYDGLRPLQSHAEVCEDSDEDRLTNPREEHNPRKPPRTGQGIALGAVVESLLGVPGRSRPDGLLRSVFPAASCLSLPVLFLYPRPRFK